MAKRTRKKGCGTSEQQIERLRDVVGPEGEEKANTIINKYDVDVIKLACKIITQSERRAPGLGERVEAMIAAMPKAKQEETRAGLLAAKEKVKEKVKAAG